MKFWILLLINFFTQVNFAQGLIYLKADRLFDGEILKEKQGILIKDNKIELVDNQLVIEKNLPAGTQTIDLGNATLLPGLIEGHSHLLLHAYNETSWDDQVLRESRAERVSRATVHAEKTLLAGFTTVRDLGTEGADFDDVGLKAAMHPKVLAPTSPYHKGQKKPMATI
jgi:imidazolonepropionase-like amidohydrolase